MIKKAISLFLVITFVLSLSFTDYSYAEGQRPSASEIPAGSLIIGTHIISIKALNNKLLEVAQKSASDTKQEKVYYKSEFNNNTWMDITNASSFEDISTKGNPVSNNVIDALILTHMTGDDGKTIEFDGEPDVDIYKLINYLDPNNYPELEEIKKLKEQLEKKPKITPDDKRQLESINGLLSPMNLTEYNNIEKTMDTLQSYISYLKNDKKEVSQVISIPQALLEQQNAKKLLCAYTELSNRLAGGQLYALSVETDVKPAYSDLATKYGSAMQEVNKKIVELQNKIGPTDSSSENNVEVSASPLDSERKLAEASLLLKVTDGFKSADEPLKIIQSIDSIVANNIVDADYELSILKPLLQKENDNFLSLANKGNSDSYILAKLNKEPVSVLETKKSEDIEKIKESSRNIDELKEYIKMRTKDPKKITTLLAEIRDNTLKATLAVPQCDTKKEILDLINSLLQKQNNEVATAKVDEESANTINRNDGLSDTIAEKKLLTDMYNAAVEKGDLDAASIIENKINELEENKSIDEASAAKEYQNLIKEKNNLEKELEKAMTEYNGISSADAPIRLFTDKLDEIILKANDINEKPMNDIKKILDKTTPSATPTPEDQNNLSALREDASKEFDNLLKNNPALIDILNNALITLKKDLANKDYANDILNPISELKKAVEGINKGLSNDKKDIQNKINKLEKDINNKEINKSKIEELKKELDKITKDIVDEFKKYLDKKARIIEKLKEAKESYTKINESKVNKDPYLDKIKMCNQAIDDVNKRLIKNKASLDVKNKLLLDMYKEKLDILKNALLTVDESAPNIAKDIKTLLNSIPKSILDDNTIKSDMKKLSEAASKEVLSLKEKGKITDATKLQELLGESSKLINGGIPADDSNKKILELIIGTESKLGLDYPENPELILDDEMQKKCLIQRAIILEKALKNPKIKVNSMAAKKYINEIVGKLKNLEKNKYDAALLKSSFAGKFELLPLNSLIFDESSINNQYPIALSKGSLFIPLRAFAAYIDSRVLWKPATNEALLVKGIKKTVFRAKSNIAISDNKEEKMEAASISINSTFYVPVGYLIKKLDKSYLWFTDSKVLLIYDKSLDLKLKT